MPEQVLSPDPAGTLREACSPTYEDWVSVVRATRHTSWRPASVYTKNRFIFTAIKPDGELWSVSGLDATTVTSELKSQMGI
jgi:hypothetical protein